MIKNIKMIIKKVFNWFSIDKVPLDKPFKVNAKIPALQKIDNRIINSIT